jgi:hypothetical protein
MEKMFYPEKVVQIIIGVLSLAAPILSGAYNFKLLFPVPENMGFNFQ